MRAKIIQQAAGVLLVTDEGERFFTTRGPYVYCDGRQVASFDGSTIRRGCRPLIDIVRLLRRRELRCDR